MAIEPRSLAGTHFKIVINATSIGLNTPVPRDLWPDKLFAPEALAYDLVYELVHKPGKGRGPRRSSQNSPSPGGRGRREG